MNDYYLVRFNMTPCMESETDILAALLEEKNFESFVPDAEGLSAYVKKELYDAAAVREVVASYPFEGKIEFSEELIPGQDWNSEWEKNYFQPIVFENRCVVHSSFHHDYPSAEYDIVIDPRMAFGTGHHETTSMMIGRLLNNNLEGLSLLDMGTGTGILPILLHAKYKGQHYTGLEIQPESADMARRSVAYNSLEDKIDIVTGDIKEAAEQFGPASFDVITTNPPYMIGEHGLKNEKEALYIARHEALCTLDDVLAQSAKVLKVKGRFYMVHRPFRLPEIMAKMCNYGLEPKRMRLVYPYVDKEPNMVLIEGRKGGNPRMTVEAPLIVYEKDGSYTQELLKLYAGE